MAAGEGGAEPLPPPSPFLPGPERALEEAVASGKLSLAGRHLRHFPGGAARRWDLSDTTQAGERRGRMPGPSPEPPSHVLDLSARGHAPSLAPPTPPSPYELTLSAWLLCLPL